MREMTKRRDMTRASVDDIVSRYVDAAAAHHQATLAGDSKRGNVQHDIVASAYRELRRRGDEDVLRLLLEHANPGVRGWAAAHALEFAPDEGRHVLEELAQASGIEGFNAEMTLQTWREGTLKFP
jgi:hypothetical protein